MYRLHLYCTYKLHGNENAVLPTSRYAILPHDPTEHAYERTPGSVLIATSLYLSVCLAWLWLQAVSGGKQCAGYSKPLQTMDPSIQRELNDKFYDKRKLGALK